MSRHLLGVLEPSIVFQVKRDAGCPPGVTSDGRAKTRRFGPFPNRSWPDEQITSGSKWFEEINSALINANVAVLGGHFRAVSVPAKLSSPIAAGFDASAGIATIARRRGWHNQRRRAARLGAIQGKLR
jgi:hypothetical protein